MFCENCGQPLPDDARFCAFCGQSVAQNMPLSDPETDTIAEASEMLTALANDNYGETADLVRECKDRITFEEAEALLAEGYFYDAYKKFKSIEFAEY